MEIKWYWPMEMLGLVENISAEYNDGYTHYQVSTLCAQVLLYALLALIPLLFLLGFLARRVTGRAGRPAAGIWLVRSGVGLLLAYALLLATGAGPYLQLYPEGGGFISFDTLEHLLQGGYCAVLALAIYLGGRLGRPGRKAQSGQAG